jgi:hypothetical protein
LTHDEQAFAQVKIDALLATLRSSLCERALLRCEGEGA